MINAIYVFLIGAATIASFIAWLYWYGYFILRMFPNLQEEDEGNHPEVKYLTGFAGTFITGFVLVITYLIGCAVTGMCNL